MRNTDRASTAPVAVLERPSTPGADLLAELVATARVAGGRPCPWAVALAVALDRDAAAAMLADLVAAGRIKRRDLAHDPDEPRPGTVPDFTASNLCTPRTASALRSAHAPSASRFATRQATEPRRSSSSSTRPARGAREPRDAKPSVTTTSTTTGAASATALRRAVAGAGAALG